MYGLSQLQTRNQKLERIVQLMFSRQNMTEVECQVDTWSFPTFQQPYHGVNPRRSFKGASFRIHIGRKGQNNCRSRRWCNGIKGLCITRRGSAVEPACAQYVSFPHLLFKDRKAWKEGACLIGRFSGCLSVFGMAALFLMANRKPNGNWIEKWNQSGAWVVYRIWCSIFKRG